MVKVNHVSVLEAFAPAIETLKNGLSGDVEAEREVLPDPETRAAVYFKFRMAKNYFKWAFRRRVLGDLLIGFGGMIRRYDKKRRAEYILRQSIEDPQELTQQ